MSTFFIIFDVNFVKFADAKVSHTTDDKPWCDCNVLSYNMLIILKRYITILCMVLVAAVSLQARDFVLVLDAGHGGHDSGAVGAHGKEKDINLAVSKLVRDKVKSQFDHVKVVMTRDDDYFVTLQDRAAIANRNNGDLFISIHVNSVSLKAKNRNTISGAQVYTLGLHKSEAALDVAQRENSVMMLESDYSTRYMGFDPESPEMNIIFELTQNKNFEQSIELADAIENQLTTVAERDDKGVRQAGFWVLWATSMPAVLIELDFISNPVSESYLMSDTGREALATAITNAFGTYLVSYGPQVMGADAPTAANTIKPVKRKKVVDNTPNPASPTVTTPGRTYKVQILVSDKKLSHNSPLFRGINETEYYVENDLYKYTVGCLPTLEEANKLLETLRPLFNDAFVIEFENGKRIH